MPGACNDLFVLPPAHSAKFLNVMNICNLHYNPAEEQTGIQTN